MEWTDEMPAKAGFYYQRILSSNIIYLVAVRIILNPTTAFVEVCSNPNEDAEPSGEPWEVVDDASNINCEWAGPLPSPPKVST